MGITTERAPVMIGGWGGLGIRGKLTKRLCPTPFWLEASPGFLPSLPHLFEEGLELLLRRLRLSGAGDGDPERGPLRHVLGGKLVRYIGDT